MSGRNCAIGGKCNICLGWLPVKRKGVWCKSCCRALRIRSRIMAYEWGTSDLPKAPDHEERCERYLERATAGLPLFEEVRA